MYPVFVHRYYRYIAAKRRSSKIAADHSTSQLKSEQMQDHLNVCAANWTTTILAVHLVCARLTETPVATWHKRDTLLIALCDEADLAVNMATMLPETVSITAPELLMHVLVLGRL